MPDGEQATVITGTAEDWPDGRTPDAAQAHAPAQPTPLVRGGPEPRRRPSVVPHRGGSDQPDARRDARGPWAAVCWTRSTFGSQQTARSRSRAGSTGFTVRVAENADSWSERLRW